VPSTLSDAEGRSKSNGTSVRSPRISVSVSKKTKGSPGGQGGEAFDLVAVGVALAESRCIEGQDLGAEFDQEAAHGRVRDARISRPRRARLRFGHEEASGKVGFAARNEAQNRTASYCRRPACATTTTLKGGAGCAFRFLLRRGLVMAARRSRSVPHGFPRYNACDREGPSRDRTCVIVP
jgi:hypothetical protein